MSGLSGITLRGPWGVPGPVEPLLALVVVASSLIVDTALKQDDRGFN
jgi:hypothetical protein